jgi:hypothetical protein
MSRRRGALCVLVVFSLALTLALPGGAEAGPLGKTQPAAEASLSGNVWSQLASWLSILRKPLSVFEGVDCDQGILIDPNGGGSSCGLSGEGGPDDAAGSPDGGPTLPNS